MRLDRVLTLGLFGPLHRAAVRGGVRRTPILMYHSVARDLDRARQPYFRTVTSPEVFARHMEWLHANGWSTITLAQAIEQFGWPIDRTPAASRQVVITFDDGFRDFEAEAFPILQRAGFVATAFVPTAFIGKDFVTGRRCLDAGEIRALADRGIEFGSHSASHRRLVTLQPHELRDELRQSRDAIEQITGRAATSFAFPFRFPEQDAGFVATLARMMDECGYRGGVTTSIGRAAPHDDRRFLPRLPINDCDDEPLFRAKLLGHYDWLRSGQWLRKRARTLWPNRPRAGAAS